MTLLWVMAGSALGAVARLWLANQVQRLIGSRFPWGTLTVNVTGALLIGLLAGGLLDSVSPQHTPAWSLLVIGVLGSYTTVSSFTLQTLALWQSRQHYQAAFNVLASLALCISAAALGFSATAPA